MALGNDQFREPAADSLRARPSQGLLGPDVPLDNHPAAIHHECGIGRGLRCCVAHLVLFRLVHGNPAPGVSTWTASMRAVDFPFMRSSWDVSALMQKSVRRSE